MTKFQKQEVVCRAIYFAINCLQKSKDFTKEKVSPQRGQQRQEREDYPEPPRKIPRRAVHQVRELQCREHGKRFNVPALYADVFGATLNTATGQVSIEVLLLDSATSLLLLLLSYKFLTQRT